MGLISLPLASPANAANPAVVAGSLVVSLAFFVIFIFLQGGALGLVRDKIKTGAANLSGFVGYGKKYYVRILGLLGLYVLIAVALVLVLALVGSGILLVGNNIFTRTLVGAIALIATVITIVLLLFPIYSIVLEDNGVFQAVKAGLKVAKSDFWKTLGLFTVLILASVLISLVIGFIAGLVTIPLPFGITQIVITIVNSAVQSYVPIVMMAALMGYYMGLKRPAEGSQAGPAA